MLFGYERRLINMNLASRSVRIILKLEEDRMNRRHEREKRRKKKHLNNLRTQQHHLQLCEDNKNRWSGTGYAVCDMVRNTSCSTRLFMSDTSPSPASNLFIVNELCN